MIVTEATQGQRLRAGRPDATRRLAVCWQHPTGRQITPVGLLEYDGSTYSFRYLRRAQHLDGFRPLLGFPDVQRRYESPRLFPLFAQRVMDPRRPDYSRYVQQLGLPGDASPWEQMARSGGAREGDLLQLFPEPEVLADGTVTCTYLVHGLRHLPGRTLLVENVPTQVASEQLLQRLSTLVVGQPLRLIREPGNESDSRAVLTTTEDAFPLGWVPSLLLDDLYAMSEGSPERVTVSVEQVNGPDAPPHMRLLARLTARSAAGYRPFSGPAWEALA